MKINSSYILLKEIRCYAYHGVAPQENLIVHARLLWAGMALAAFRG